MKYFLIHGYGKALDLFESVIPANGGFDIFDEEIALGEAYVHHWAEQIERRRLTAWSPLTQLKLYYQERIKTQSPAEHERLYQVLTDGEPKVIITHSSGARLLMNYLKSYSLPESVKKVILVQADISPKEWQECNLPPEVAYKNFWCWWDQALISSMILNRYIPWGLYSNDRTYSQFYALRMLPNPHQDIWRDRKFKEIIKKEE